VRWAGFPTCSRSVSGKEKQVAFEERNPTFLRLCWVSLGLDAREYDIHVIKKTNENAGRVFPLMLDVENPEFYQRLDTCISNNEKLSAIANSSTPKFLQIFQKLPLYISNGWQLLRLYLMKPIDTVSAQGAVR
jgi:magnesium-protoporphyrin IX monomethyl ester (oxidative) cyclase